MQRLRGRHCEAFNSDTKIRIQLPTHVRFYYSDAVVVCRPNPESEAFQDAPTVVVEVLCERTRRTDQGEKREGTQTLVPLPEIETELPLSEIYERVVFSSEAAEEP